MPGGGDHIAGALPGILPGPRCAPNVLPEVPVRVSARRCRGSSPALVARTTRRCGTGPPSPGVAGDPPRPSLCVPSRGCTATRAAGVAGDPPRPSLRGPVRPGSCRGPPRRRCRGSSPALVARSSTSAPRWPLAGGVAGILPGLVARCPGPPRAGTGTRRRCRDPPRPSRNPRVEQVLLAGSAKHQPRLPPPARNAQRVRMHGGREPRARCPRITVVLVLRLAHRLEPARHGQGVAVVAAGRDPVTAGRGVPGGGGPLHRAAVSHAGSPPRPCSARVRSYARALTASWPPAARPAPAQPGQPAVRTSPRALAAPPAGGIRGSGPRRRRRRPHVCWCARYSGRTTAAAQRHAGAAGVARAGTAGRRGPPRGCGSLRCSHRHARPGRPESTRPPGRRRRPGQAGGAGPW